MFSFNSARPFCCSCSIVQLSLLTVFMHSVSSFEHEMAKSAASTTPRDRNSLFIFLFFLVVGKIGFVSFLCT